MSCPCCTTCSLDALTGSGFILCPHLTVSFLFTLIHLPYSRQSTCPFFTFDLSCSFSLFLIKLLDARSPAVCVWGWSAKRPRSAKGCALLSGSLNVMQFHVHQKMRIMFLLTIWPGDHNSRLFWLQSQTTTKIRNTKLSPAMAIETLKRHKSKANGKQEQRTDRARAIIYV